MCDVWHIFFVHKRIATGYIDRVSSMRASSWCVPDNFSSRKLCRPLKQPSRFCTKIPRTKILSDQCYCSEIILLQLRRIHCQQLVTLFVDYSANGVNWIFKIHNFFSTCKSPNYISTQLMFSSLKTNSFVAIVSQF